MNRALLRVKIAGINVRGAIRAWRRQIRGTSGVFAVPEQSAQSVRLTDLWDANWPGDPPLGDRLRNRYRDRWVRFHSLPGSKQYSDSAGERREIVRRHRALLDGLLDGAPLNSLVVIASDYGPHDTYTGWTRTYLCEAWPWRRFFDAGDTENWFYFWVRSDLASDELDDLLGRAADEQAFFIVVGDQADWLYCPYPGGVDVVLPNEIGRDKLASQYATWLPADQ